MISISKLRRITCAEYSFVAEVEYAQMVEFTELLAKLKEQYPDLQVHQYPHIGGGCTYIFFVKTVDNPQAIHHRVKYGMERN